MAIFDEALLTTDSSQTVNPVNVGQFGPNYDNLQDWRSVFAIAEEVRKIAADIKKMQDVIEVLDTNSTKILDEAQSAATLATEINQTTIDTVQTGWAETERLHQEVVIDKAAVETSEQIVTSHLAAILEEVAKASVFALESEKAMDVAEEVVGTLTNIQATAHYAIGDAPTATYNPSTGELRIGIPARLKADATGVQSVWHNGGFVSGPEIKLTAADVGAFAIDGSSDIEVPLGFKISNRQGFVAEAKTTGETGHPEFRVLYAELGNPRPRQGLILDALGNGAFGGELYVSNVTANPSRVYHERFRPTARDVGAAPIETVYTKEQADELFMQKGADTYTRVQIDAKVATKISPAPSDGKVYTWIGSQWVSIADNKVSLDQLFGTIGTNTTAITDLSTRLDEEINKPVIYTKSIWKGNTRTPVLNLLSGRIYTLVIGQGNNVLSSVTFAHSTDSDVYTVTSNTGSVAISKTGDMVATDCKIKEIICHNFKKGDTYNGH